MYKCFYSILNNFLSLLIYFFYVFFKYLFNTFIFINKIYITAIYYISQFCTSNTILLKCLLLQIKIILHQSKSHLNYKWVLKNLQWDSKIIRILNKLILKIESANNPHNTKRINNVLSNLVYLPKSLLKYPNKEDHWKSFYKIRIDSQT